MSTTLLVDGNNLLVRAVHAAYGARMSADAVNTGPLVIFINTLARHVRIEEPTRVLVAWDHPGGASWRRELFADYKAQRKQASPDADELRRTNFALAREFCALAGVPQTSRTGFEADDVIASAWATVEDGRIVILSSDNDFLQLVGDNPHGVPTEQVRLSSGSGTSRADTDRWDAERVRTGLKHGPVPEPGALALIKALQGDTSDNVPGLRGIGPVKAYKLLAQHDWDIQRVMEARPDDAQQIDLNLRLVDLRRDHAPMPPIPKWEPTAPGSLAFAGLVEFLNRYQMQRVLDRVRANTLWRESDVAELSGRPGFRFVPGE